MNIAGRTFKPKLAPVISVIVLLPVLLSLGFWQLGRAEEKEQRFNDFQLQSSLPPLDLNGTSWANMRQENLLWRKAMVRGVFDTQGHYLLDNQVVNGRPGYFVYTSLWLEGHERWLLVNRGWLDAGNYRNKIPVFKTPAKAVKLHGKIKGIPVTGIRLGNESIESFADGVVRVQRIDLEQIGASEGKKLLPFILRLTPVSEHGFLRTWREPGSGKEKHLGYAFQWFALAAGLVVIFVFVNLKKQQVND